jgi:hypothetical protein
VRVGIQGEAHCGMAESLGDHLRIDSGRQCQDSPRCGAGRASGSAPRCSRSAASQRAPGTSSDAPGAPLRRVGGVTEMTKAIRCPLHGERNICEGVISSPRDAQALADRGRRGS